MTFGVGALCCEDLLKMYLMGVISTIIVIFLNSDYRYWGILYKSIQLNRTEMADGLCLQ